MKGEEMEFLCGTWRVYERDMGGVVGEVGDGKRSVESPSETSEAGGKSFSGTAGGEPGTVSNLIVDHTDWEKSSSGEGRRRIGGRFLETRESNGRVSDKEGRRGL